MQVANQTTVLGDFDDAEFDYFGQKTRFFRRDNEFIVATQDADGQEQEYKVTYTDNEFIVATQNEDGQEQE